MKSSHITINEAKNILGVSITEVYKLAEVNDWKIVQDTFTKQFTLNGEKVKQFSSKLDNVLNLGEETRH